MRGTAEDGYHEIVYVVFVAGSRSFTNMLYSSFANVPYFSVSPLSISIAAAVNSSSSTLP